MDLQGIVRRLLPKEDFFFTILERQARIAVQAAEALERFKGGAHPSEDVRVAIQKLEHEGDRQVLEMEDALAHNFVTPFDREDLHRLCSELDDILDVANLVMRQCVLFGMDQPTPPMDRLIDTFLECARVVNQAVSRLRHHDYNELLEDARVLRKLEKEGDIIFREAVSALFRNESIEAKVLIREKAILESLEHAIDQCDHMAGALSRLAVKNK